MPSEEERTTTIGTMYKKLAKFGRAIFELCERTDRQTDRQADTLTSHHNTSVSTGMGDRLRASIPPRYVTKPTRSTQPSGSLNRVPALIGWGRGGNVTSAGWQVTLCDPIWHVTSRSGEAVCELLYSALLRSPSGEGRGEAMTE